MQKMNAISRMTTAVLEFAGRRLTLTRPGTNDPSLRAWNAADELLLREAFAHLQHSDREENSAGQASGRTGKKVLVIDDQFGALTLGLADAAPDVVADNAQLRGALTLNASLNPECAVPAQIYSWQQPPGGGYDLILLKIPREADYLAWLLRWANQALNPDGTLLAAGMIKHLPDRSVNVFAAGAKVQHVGRVVKKARLITCGRGNALLADWPGTWKGYALDESEGLGVTAMPAVFAREKLDMGTQLMLPHLNRLLAPCRAGDRVLDLACGNGVLGLRALALNPELDVTFSDVSSQAVLSARHNILAAFPGARVTFHHCDGVARDAGQFERILLNPPFHEGGVVGDHIALRLFEQASRSLSARGRLLLVGNRHLGYHRSLRRFFANTRQLDASSRFVVLEAWHG